MSNQALSKQEETKAKELYRKFWNQNPNIPNPTDINSKEKHDFCKTISYEDLSLMQRARKIGATTYPFTQEMYFTNSTGR